MASMTVIPPWEVIVGADVVGEALRLQALNPSVSIISVTRRSTVRNCRRCIGRTSSLGHVQHRSEPEIVKHMNVEAPRLAGSDYFFVPRCGASIPYRGRLPVYSLFAHFVVC
jgi:hypothetical protein